jgi:hypothetical protein
MLALSTLLEVVMAKAHLESYLNDHLAGSVVALELLQDLLDFDPGPADLKQCLTDLKDEITEDRKELEALMHRLGIAESRGRKVASWLSEKVARIKMRADDKASGLLCLFESLEALELGIHGKWALWRALSTAAGVAPALRGVAFDELSARAESRRRASRRSGWKLRRLLSHLEKARGPDLDPQSFRLDVFHRPALV